MTTDSNLATAVLGGGCFWCLDAVFRELDGVRSVESGYAGGRTPNPTYEQVCSGTTGHAEVVRVAFDPAVIAFRDLLRVFFTIHDPTTLNRQGNDIGTQYRSVIFCQTPEQRTDWEAGVRSLYDGMVRIVVTPTWAKLIDFETTLPSAVEELARQRDERQRA